MRGWRREDGSTRLLLLIYATAKPSIGKAGIAGFGPLGRLVASHFSAFPSPQSLMILFPSKSLQLIMALIIVKEKSGQEVALTLRPIGKSFQKSPVTCRRRQPRDKSRVYNTYI